MKFINSPINIIILLIIFLLAISSAFGVQPDTVKINETLIITGKLIPYLYKDNSRIINIISRPEIENSPSLSFDDLMKFQPGIDIRQRGVSGVQSDISIRDGSFKQTLILLNGIPMNDPQTGHHNMDIPVDLSNISRIEILNGPGSRLLGPDVFSGEVNIITENNPSKKLRLSAAGGEYDYYNTKLNASYNFGKFPIFCRFQIRDPVLI